jgi:hypothetical protein
MSQAGGLRRGWLAVGLAVAFAFLLAAVLLGIAIGTRSLPLAEVLGVLGGHDDTDAAIIIWEQRIPRTLLGVLIGAALGVGGAVAQGITRNPLADPALLGVSAGAALAIVVGSFAFGISALAPQIGAATVGAAITGGVVLFLAGYGRGGMPPTSLALVGLSLSALIVAVVSVLVLLDAQTLDQYRFWLVGALSGRGAPTLSTVATALLTKRCPRSAQGGRATVRGTGPADPPEALVTIPTTLIPHSAVAELGARVDGDVLMPDDARFVEASRAWNTRYVHQPALVVLPISTTDVAEVVRFAAAAGIPVAVQSTGHGTTREASGAILLNLAHLADVRVDAATGRAWIGGGATWQPVLDAATPHGLAPLVGAAGTALTGSTTASNALLAPLQADAARQLGLPVTTLLTAQTAGGNLGNALTPINALVAGAAAGAQGAEGEILRRSSRALIPIALLVIAGVAVLVVFG